MRRCWPACCNKDTNPQRRGQASRGRCTATQSAAVAPSRASPARWTARATSPTARAAPAMRRCHSTAPARRAPRRPHPRVLWLRCCLPRAHRAARPSPRRAAARRGFCRCLRSSGCEPLRPPTRASLAGSATHPPHPGALTLVVGLARLQHRVLPLLPAVPPQHSNGGVRAVAEAQHHVIGARRHAAFVE